MKRRQFLKLTGTVAMALVFEPLQARALKQDGTPLPKFPDADPKWKRTWDAALTALSGNVKLLATYKHPVLIEGAEYRGIWLECAPTESLVYANLANFVPHVEGKPSPVEIARANHTAFFELQREDGQLPAYIWTDEVGYGQIQMVVPVAATAWDLVQQTKDEALLKTTYAACSRWDAWLRRYRNTRKSGLVEGFCTYDTGMDNSPRWAGMPNSCPDNDARKCPPVPSLPRLCPDLSATVYGGRIALAAMAQALGHKTEADQWLEDAETIRKLILQKLYCAEDAAFYDLDAQGKFVRVRSDVISRVMGEHVLKLEVASDRQIFDEVWTRQLHNPNAFWARYPFTSVAMNDPLYVRSIPPNSWGGATQALTALRASRWMDHYGKQRDFKHLMQQWIVAINNSGKSTGQFFQQMNPKTGEFTRNGAEQGYSSTALLYLDFVRRLQSTPS
jgi:hypothetical protein